MLLVSFLSLNLTRFEGVSAAFVGSLRLVVEDDEDELLSLSESLTVSALLKFWERVCFLAMVCSDKQLHAPKGSAKLCAGYSSVAHKPAGSIRELFFSAAELVGSPSVIGQQALRPSFTT